MNRQIFMNDLHDGQKKCCPTCGRHAQIYRRRIHKSVAAALIRLYKLGGADDYIHVSELMMPGMSGIGDLGKATFWGLIVPMKNEDEKKRTSGMWHLTEKGVSFVKGEMGIREFAHVYDAEVIEFSGRNVFINDCLGAEFNYSEMMGRAA